MHVEAKMSGHWTDEQLIAHMYGVDPQQQQTENAHLTSCQECQLRLADMHSLRNAITLDAESAIDPEFLADQRRRLYARIAEPEHWWQLGTVWRWASVGTAMAALSAGLFIFGDNHQLRTHENKVSDAELAREVSALSLDLEAQPAEPLQALFE